MAATDEEEDDDDDDEEEEEVEEEEEEEGNNEADDEASAFPLLSDTVDMEWSPSGDDAGWPDCANETEEGSHTTMGQSKHSSPFSSLSCRSASESGNEAGYTCECEAGRPAVSAFCKLRALIIGWSSWSVAHMK